ncbi:PPC domain-containing protein [Myxosarcina sp. GI1]|uniref:PPC domain-containing protein n=1 Tax=Myxosarcina sp. GI1 TaxID=1541065 RepID=UPI00068D89F9|nr:PPC domain-containing protein [Myxosarcina sp. GI1]
MFDLDTFRVNKAILVSLSTLLLPGAIAVPMKVRAQQANSFSSTTQLLAQAQTAAIESEILAEINRARTQPQAYADWLEQQQQYYQGILLKLPGEQAIRTNRGFKALQEAIAFLRQQPPLPPLSSSEALSATAETQLDAIFNFTNGININLDNISYSLVTPQAIVMQLIVDDRFPDRRRRLSLFTTESEQAGIVCEPDERYDNICAIAYKPDSAIASNTRSDTEVTTTETATLPPPTPPENSQSTISSTVPEPPANNSTPDIFISPTEETVESLESSNSENSLPEVPSIEVAVPPAETVADTEVANQTEANTSEEVAITQNDSRLLEKVERGALASGDKTVPDDGSFYDSYPLEGDAGESFIVSLESDEFDTFVAVMDAEGKILEQNDDISDDNSNSRLRVTLPDKGVYQVIVNAYDEGGTGSYVLTISR